MRRAGAALVAARAVHPEAGVAELHISILLRASACHRAGSPPAPVCAAQVTLPPCCADANGGGEWLTNGSKLKHSLLCTIKLLKAARGSHELCSRASAGRGFCSSHC